MKRIALLGLLAALVACERRKLFAIARPDPATKRLLADGEVVGGEGRYGSHAWLSIPFAAPPVGELRWRAPAPPKPWTGVRQALAFPPPCPQYASVMGGVDGKAGETVGDEDCLSLAVWAPRFGPEAIPKGQGRLPVMFWIHGGGNSIGRAAFFDGGNLAVRERVIVVAVQYRLGPFGWLSHPALRAGAASPAEGSGNFGLLDQIRGLEWVRENVAAFGGDPGNVTIFGESAGAMDVVALLMSPRAKGLFHRAIVESGGLRHTTVEDAEHLTDDPSPGHPYSSGEVLLKMLQHDGLAAGREAAKAKLATMSAPELARYLRGKSATEILQTYDVSRAAGMIDMPLVFADGAFLPKDDWLEKLATPSGWNRVPVIIGTNRDEMKLFQFLDKRRIHWRLGLVPRFVDEKDYLANAEWMSRMWKATGVDEPAAAMRRSGWKDVYAYRFDWDEQPTLLGASLPKMVGAAHGMEIPFVFGHFELGPMAAVLFPREGRTSRERLSRQMMSYWGEMAWAGAPGQGRAGDQARWSAWDESAPERPKFMLLDTLGNGGLRMSAAAESRATLLAAIEEDPRLPTQRDRCRIYHDLVSWARGLPKDVYLKAGKLGCAEYPFEKYPWDGEGGR
jgi:para-nitrobenzyl esterase